MNFSSPRFLVFLVAVLVVLAPRYSDRRKKQVLAVASCLFYAAWDYRYLGLLILVSAIDYVCAAKIHASDDETVRRRWVAASIVSNLGILGYFKYVDFFIANLNGVLGPALHQQLPVLDVLLPAGISFYTFKSMSYTIDVNRRHIEPVQSWLDYTTFITFFPELIAGPIVRASIFLPQMDRRIGPTKDRLLVGFNIFVLGLLKKLVIADRVAAIVDPIFASPQDYSASSLWLGAIAYAIQIYCDFSGYSDMAIGCAKMVGFDLPENFSMPYASRDITEFWRRWHMTLSFWLRDYLYIPLGGNRGSATRTYANLLITMLLGGLWHGASWNFVLWGACHGGALAFHRMLSRRIKAEIPDAVSWAITLLFVVLTWIPFRAPSFSSTFTMLSRMFGFGSGGGVFWPEHLAWVVPVVVLAHIAGKRMERAASTKAPFPGSDLGAVLDVETRHHEISGPYLVFKGRTVMGAFVVVIALATVFYYAPSTSSPFIYFQF